MKKRILSLMLVLSMIASVIIIMPTTVSAAQEKTNAAKYVHDFVMNNMGMNCAAACAVCANIEEESGFNPKATGDSGTSYGICQWRNNNFTRLKTYCSNNGYDYTTLEAQMNFLNWDLADQGKWLLNYLKNTENTADGAYNAAYYFCTTYEKPSDADSKGKVRGNLARDTYWTYFSNSSSVAPVSPSTTPSTPGFVASGNCGEEKVLTYTENGKYKDANGNFFDISYSDSVKWFFDGNDTLVFKGSGRISDYGYAALTGLKDFDKYPIGFVNFERGWEQYVNRIKRVYIGEGVTYIGAWVFNSSDPVEEIYVLEPTCMIASGANYPDCKIYAYKSDEYNSLCQYASASYTKSTYIEINSSNAPKLPNVGSGDVETKAVSFDISPKSGKGNIILGRDENGNGIYEPKTGDKFTFTIVTSSNVNEISICGDKSDETKWHEISYQYLKDNYELKNVDNGDGTKTWTAKIYLNEPGYRTFMVRANGQDTDIKASVNVNAQNTLVDDETTAPPTQGGGFTDDNNADDNTDNNNGGSFSDTPQQGQELTNPDGTWGDQPKEPEQPIEPEYPEEPDYNEEPKLNIPIPDSMNDNINELITEQKKQLSAPVVNASSNIKIGESLNISWSNVDNAENYAIFAWVSNGEHNTYRVSASETSYNIDTSSYLSGVHTIQVVAQANGYSQSDPTKAQKRISFIGGKLAKPEFDNTNPHVLKGNNYKLTIKENGADFYSLQVSVPGQNEPKVYNFDSEKVNGYTTYEIPDSSSWETGTYGFCLYACMNANENGGYSSIAAYQSDVSKWGQIIVTNKEISLAKPKVTVTTNATKNQTVQGNSPIRIVYSDKVSDKKVKLQIGTVDYANSYEAYFVKKDGHGIQLNINENGVCEFDISKLGIDIEYGNYAILVYADANGNDIYSRSLTNFNLKVEPYLKLSALSFNDKNQIIVDADVQGECADIIVDCDTEWKVIWDDTAWNWYSGGPKWGYTDRIRASITNNTDKKQRNCTITVKALYNGEEVAKTTYEVKQKGSNLPDTSKNNQNYTNADIIVTDSNNPYFLGYGSYDGIAYWDWTNPNTGKKISSERKAVLDKAKQMVTLMWTPPYNFKTWRGKDGYNSTTSISGKKDTQFYASEQYLGIPYSMSYHKRFNGYRTNELDDNNWLQVLSFGQNNIPVTDINGNKQEIKIEGTSAQNRKNSTIIGVDCAGLVYRAMQQVFSNVQYAETSAFLVYKKDANGKYIKDANGNKIKMYDANGRVLFENSVRGYKLISCKIKANDSNVYPADIFVSDGHVIMAVGISPNGYYAFESSAGGSKCRYKEYTMDDLKNYAHYRYSRFTD